MTDIVERLGLAEWGTTRADYAMHKQLHEQAAAEITRLREDFRITSELLGDATNLIAEKHKEITTLRAEVERLRGLLKQLEIDPAKVGPAFRDLFAKAKQHPAYWQEGVELANDEIESLRTQLDKAREALEKAKDYECLEYGHESCECPVCVIGRALKEMGDETKSDHKTSEADTPS